MILTVVQVNLATELIMPWREFFRDLEEVKAAICQDLANDHRAYAELQPEHIAMVDNSDDQGVFAEARVDEHSFLITQIRPAEYEVEEAAA